jgi:hypothetical protein
MDYITGALSRLAITVETNFEYIGIDTYIKELPKKFTPKNDLFFECRTLIISAIFTFSYLYGPQLARYLVTEYRRSDSTPEKAEQFFFGYNVPKHEIVKDEHYYNALDIVTCWFQPTHPIHPVHFTDLRWYPWNLSTNAERPFNVRADYQNEIRSRKEQGDPTLIGGKLSFHNLYNSIFQYSRYYIHKVKEGISVPLHRITLHAKPAIVHGQKADKVRTVFGVPKPVIFAEAMFHWPLFSNYFTSGKSPLLWNYETLNGGWNRLNAEWYSRFQSFYPVFNLDWSEFDMRLYFDMWHDCRERVKTYFCFCGAYCPTRTYPHPRTNPSRLQNLWTWIEHAYFDTECASPLGNVYRRKFAGMPSGIFCTQFWDSFYNSVMIVTILLSLGLTVDRHHFFKVMGDDVLFGLLSHIPVEQWLSFLESFQLEASRRFGSKLSPDKCGVSKTIQGAQVLGYFNWNGYPIRDLDSLLAALLNPKSNHDSQPRLMARCIGIYYASAADKRVRAVTKHIYDDLERQGFTPSVSGLRGMFDKVYGYTDPIDLTHFPTELEAMARLAKISKRDPDLQSQYWDLTHFSMEAGLAHCEA